MNRNAYAYHSEPTTITPYLIGYAFVLVICLVIVYLVIKAIRSRSRSHSSNQSNTSTNATDCASTNCINASITVSQSASSSPIKSTPISQKASRPNAETIPAGNKIVHLSTTTHGHLLGYGVGSQSREEVLAATALTRLQAPKMKAAEASSLRHIYTSPVTQTAVVRRKVVTRSCLVSEVRDEPAKSSSHVTRHAVTTSRCDAGCSYGGALSTTVSRRRLPLETHAPCYLLKGASNDFIYRPSSTRFIITQPELPPPPPKKVPAPPRTERAPKTKLFDGHIINSEPPEKKLDLRGEYLDPATEKFRKFFRSMKKVYTHNGYKEEDRYIYVVTGYGKFSENGIPKIKPTVQSYLDTNSIRHFWLNAGLVMIDFCKEKDEVKD